MRRGFVLFLSILVLGSELPTVRAFQTGTSYMQELRHRQSAERKALRIQQKALKQTRKGPEYSRLERKRMKRQMKAERKLLRAGQRDERLSARERMRFAENNPDDPQF
jgi:hypothetical protein